MRELNDQGSSPAQEATYRWYTWNFSRYRCIYMEPPVILSCPLPSNILVTAPASWDAPQCTNMTSYIILLHLWPPLWSCVPTHSPITDHFWSWLSVQITWTPFIAFWPHPQLTFDPKVNDNPNEYDGEKVHCHSCHTPNHDVDVTGSTCCWL